MMKTFKGKIAHEDLEGGFWTLEADDGEVYKLEGGDKGLMQAGKRVEVEGAVDEEAMGIGFGAPVLKVNKYKVL
jgi:Protein of unknown function (DUF5818)